MFDFAPKNIQELIEETRKCLEDIGGAACTYQRWIEHNIYQSKIKQNQQEILVSTITRYLQVMIEQAQKPNPMDEMKKILEGPISALFKDRPQTAHEELSEINKSLIDEINQSNATKGGPIET